MASKANVEGKKDNAELRKKIEYQVACEERAHRIVERLIYNPVTQEQLVDALHFITPSHYSDIVEERAVSKLCGYPICPNELSKVPKQKYVISTKTNKVYDIEASKNFCSGQCYKASKHLASQVSSDPVWSRKQLRPTQYDFLPLNSKSGKVGDEVLVSKAGEIKEDLKRLEKLDNYQKNLADRIQEHNLKTEKGEAVRTSEHEDKDNDIDDDAGDNESKESVVNKDKEVDDKESDIREDNVSYTLDKAMDELSIQTNESNENDKEKHSDSSKEARGESVHTPSKKANAQETNLPNSKKSSTSKISQKSKNSNPNKSKTDYLMQLLDKRKALLSKMVDIQTEESSMTEASKQDKASEKRGDRVSSIEKTEGQIKSESSSNTITSIEKTIEDTTDVKDKSAITKISKENEDIPSKLEGPHEVKTSGKSYCKFETEKKKTKELKGTASGNPKKKPSFSPLDLISRGLKSWITENTVEYLKIDVDVVGDDVGKNTGNTTFERQYKALVAKVDAQEKDFGGLLGEESMEPDYTEKASAPLPHFEVLRQELEDDQIRVREYMKGSFTYKVQEKQISNKDDGSSKVVLPTVDKYDQMLIRQKIVLDRINKILPDILPPLQLFVQDIFTELKELIFTFNLTSDNISFKPAEWTIVTLILLRMLSRKMANVQKSFTSPGAKKYFTVLLSSISAGIEHVDVVVENLLQCEKMSRKV